MSRWADRAVDQLEKEYEDGDLSAQELREAIREVQAELEQEAQDAAERAYEDTMWHN